MEVQTLQTQREEQVRELQAKVEAVQSCSQEEVAELVGSLRALEGQREQDASRLQEELGEAEKSAELSNALVEDMQKQIDTLNHDKAKSEVQFFHKSCTGSDRSLLQCCAHLSFLAGLSKADAVHAHAAICSLQDLHSNASICLCRAVWSTS